VGEQAERGPLYEAMYEALSEESLLQGMPKWANLGRMAEAVTRVAATKIGNIARNMQPQIDSALAVAWDKGYDARGQDQVKNPSGPTPNPYRTEEAPDGG
jgi:hypothetical protein